MDDPSSRLRRLKFRAWHRGTREADYIVGGFFDRYAASWGEDELAWFEAMLDEEDVDILDWVMGTAEAPERYQGPIFEAFRKLDYVEVVR